MNHLVIPSAAQAPARIRLATAGDKAVAVAMLTESFREDPHINWYSGNGPRKRQKIRALMAYAFEKSLANGDVYITEEQTAVAIWKNQPQQRMSWGLLWETLRFLLVYGPGKVMAISKLDQQIEAKYPAGRPKYYLWVLGTHPDHQGKGLGSRLMNPLLAEAEHRGLEVYLETTNIRNLPIYEKKGFAPYDKLSVPGNPPISIYFLKK